MTWQNSVGDNTRMRVIFARDVIEITDTNCTFLAIILRENKLSGTSADCFCPFSVRRCRQWNGNLNVVEKFLELLQVV
jgi:hypothetical protein